MILLARCRLLQNNKIFFLTFKIRVPALLTSQTHFDLLEDTNFNLQLPSQYSFITFSIVVYIPCC